MKNYPLEINSVSEYEGTYAWYVSKGHHDPALFCDRLQSDWGELADPANVRYEYWRTVPQGDGPPMSVVCKPGRAGRGAYPMTVIDASDTRQIVKIA